MQPGLFDSITLVHPGDARATGPNPDRSRDPHRQVNPDVLKPLTEAPAAEAPVAEAAAPVAAGGAELGLLAL